MSLEEVKAALDEYAELCDFYDEQGQIIVKPRNFLGSDKFGKIRDAVKGLGGKYVPASQSPNGKGHFSIPKQAVLSEAQRAANALEVLVDQLEKIIADLRR